MPTITPFIPQQITVHLGPPNTDAENVTLMLTSNKGHNPNYTEDAVKYIGEFGKARAKLLRNKKASKDDKARFVESFDWHRMTKQDDVVWDKILKHLES